MGLRASELIRELAESIRRDGDHPVYMPENCQTMEGVEEIDGVTTVYRDNGRTYFRVF